MPQNMFQNNYTVFVRENNGMLLNAVKNVVFVNFGQKKFGVSIKILQFKFTHFPSKLPRPLSFLLINHNCLATTLITLLINHLIKYGIYPFFHV